MTFRRILIAAAASILLMAAAANAATADFYSNLLNRGASYVLSGNNAAAVKDLRIAAFGFVGSLAEYERAHLYLAVASARLTRDGDARASIERILVAEAIESHLHALQIPPSIRAEFDTVSQRVLAPEQLARLRAASAAPVTPPQGVASAASVPAEPATATSQPAATTPAPAVAAPSNDFATQLIAAEQAIGANDLATARSRFTALAAGKLDHEQALRVAEGAYRARDFASVVKAMKKAGKLKANEGFYRYYLAVALFETGDVKRAKKELAAALPHVEMTEDVARNRARIEAAR